MKTKQSQQQVMEILLSVLEILSPDIYWSRDNVLVREFEQRMNDSIRVYHTWDHLWFMLEEMEQVPTDLLMSLPRLRAAILFHDIVCRPGAVDNERQSALFARKFFQGRNLEAIELLISATQHKFPFTLYGDDRDYLCDFDLAPLGTKRDVFMTNVINISQEYIDTGVCIREEFLDEFQKFSLLLLQQSRAGGIYRTPLFKAWYEEIARRNLITMSR